MMKLNTSAIFIGSQITKFEISLGEYNVLCQFDVAAVGEMFCLSVVIVVHE